MLGETTYISSGNHLIKGLFLEEKFRFKGLPILTHRRNQIYLRNLIFHLICTMTQNESFCYLTSNGVIFQNLRQKNNFQIILGLTKIDFVCAIDYSI